MAISSKKISGFRELSELSGDEYLMVAFNNRSYKVKTSLFTSDIIESIEQSVVKGDEAVSPIKIKTKAGDEYTFYVKNGRKGSTGDTGKQGAKGETGNTGIALYNTDFEDRILDTLDGTDGEGNDLTNDELTSYALSAMQGTVLNDKLELLAEEYLSQEEYDIRVNMNQIYPNVKYFIISDEDITPEEENVQP